MATAMRQLDQVQAALADLPTMEPPSSGGGSGLFGQIKRYLQDGVVLGGLVVAAIAFIVVANSAISTYSEIDSGKKPGRSLVPLWLWG
ncbi:UNVERIFIED_ORG: integrating conjugative element membrane protein (TIGR03745 family) [Citrobacter freundii]